MARISCIAFVVLSFLLALFVILVAAVLFPAFMAPRAMTGAKPGLQERALAAEAHEGNPCKHRRDGLWCHFDVTLECKDGEMVPNSNKTCHVYEKCSESSGAARCEEDACKDRADGNHCKYDNIVTCKGARTVKMTVCAIHEDCVAELGAATAACVDICDRRADGRYCEEDVVIECRGSKTIVENSEECAITQACINVTRDGGTPRAACVESDCLSELDGTYCKHGGVVKCSGGVAVGGLWRCPFYQECHQEGSRSAMCKERVCEEEMDGWHCSRGHMVQCIGSATVDIHLCPMYQECERDNEERVCGSV